LAVPPKETLSSLIEENDYNLRREKEESAFLIEALTSLTKKLPCEEVSSANFKVLQGRKQVLRVVNQMAERARLEENAINTAAGIIRCVSSGISEVNENAAKRGVKMRWIAPIHVENFVEARRLCEFGEVRNLEVPSPIRFIVMDESETLISSIYDDSTSLNSEGDVAIWIDDMNISKLMNYLFYNLWKDAKPISNKLSECDLYL
jgi:hypothetical protein